MQSFFEARKKNMHALKSRILASREEREATEEKIKEIKELLLHNTQPGHLEVWVCISCLVS